MADLLARVDATLEGVAASTGFPLDQVRYVLWCDWDERRRHRLT